MFDGFKRLFGGREGSRPARPKRRLRRKRSTLATGSEDLTLSEDLIGRAAEAKAVISLLKTHRIVYLTGPPRIGKSCLAKLVAEKWRRFGPAFLYTCPASRGIGHLFGFLADFFKANFDRGFEEIHTEPDSNDDDKCVALAEALKRGSHLIILDSFGRVDARRTYRTLLKTTSGEDVKGRMLVCCRSLPENRPEGSGAYELGGFNNKDVVTYAHSQGFSGNEFSGLRRKFTHPYLLKLLICIAGTRSMSPGEILGQLAQEDLESELLAEIYEDLTPNDHNAIDALSVLRKPFRQKALEIFSDDPNATLPRSEILEFLIEPSDGWLSELHPLFKSFCSDRLIKDPDLDRGSHSKAIEYYDYHARSGGQYLAVATLEKAWHLTQSERPLEGLRILAQYSRIIISFGFGTDLHVMIKPLEAEFVTDGRCDTDEKAAVLMDLSSIYTQLQVIDVNDNHLRAIRYTGAAQEYFETAEQNGSRATALNIQGMACAGLPSGNPIKNLDRAFECYRESLLIYSSEGVPNGCAVVHNNLGTAWIVLSGLGEENHHGRAIGHFKQALNFFTDDADPYTRGLVDSNLGLTYCLVGKGKEGMEYLNLSLNYFTHDKFPKEYAETQAHLADANRLSLPGSRITRLEEAISFYGKALLILEEEIFPEDFASIQHRIGICHRQLAIYQEKQRHISGTIKCYQNALRVYTPGGFPFYHEMITLKLERDRVQFEEIKPRKVEGEAPEPG
jgi:tetratricopeptide (TPR) repeat protein